MKYNIKHTFLHFLIEPRTAGVQYLKQMRTDHPIYIHKTKLYSYKNITNNLDLLQ